MKSTWAIGKPVMIAGQSVNLRSCGDELMPCSSIGQPFGVLLTLIDADHLIVQAKLDGATLLERTTGSYDDKPKKTIAVGCKSGSPLIFYVRDVEHRNGCQASHRSFRCLPRLQARDAFGVEYCAILPIARRTVERHGEKIVVGSAPGQGTVYL